MNHELDFTLVSNLLYRTPRYNSRRKLVDAFFESDKGLYSNMNNSLELDLALKAYDTVIRNDKVRRVIKPNERRAGIVLDELVEKLQKDSFVKKDAYTSLRNARQFYSKKQRPAKIKPLLKACTAALLIYTSTLNLNMQDRVSYVDGPEIVNKAFSQYCTDIVIHVDKQFNETAVYTTDAKIASFYHTDAWNQGPKQIEGDSKTPEGIFPPAYMRSVDEGTAKRTAIYGSCRIGLAIPDSIGSGIVLCGTLIDERIQAIDGGKDSTNGGIVYKDSDMRDLYRLVVEKSFVVAIE